MDILNETGKACPLPVIETKKHLASAEVGTQVEIIVDNPTAIQNLSKFATQSGYDYALGEQNPQDFHVVLTKTAPADQPVRRDPGTVNRVVAVDSKTMGSGDDRLGTTLLKGFLYAFTELDQPPTTMLFYNGGAFLTTEGSQSIADLQALEAAGVQILTCGTCLDFYDLSDKLQVGGVTNMYSIVELMSGADVLIKP